MTGGGRGLVTHYGSLLGGIFLCFFIHICWGGEGGDSARMALEEKRMESRPFHSCIDSGSEDRIPDTSC